MEEYSSSPEEPMMYTASTGGFSQARGTFTVWSRNYSGLQFRGIFPQGGIMPRRIAARTSPVMAAARVAPRSFDKRQVSDQIFSAAESGARKKQYTVNTVDTVSGRQQDTGEYCLPSAWCRHCISTVIYMPVPPGGLTLMS